MKNKRKPKSSKSSENSHSGILTEREVEVIHRQIRNNSLAIDHCIEVIDLLVNKERCPKDANTLAWLRERLSVAVAENDTFRKVIWRHTQLVQSQTLYDGDSEAAAFLIGQIKSRERALIAQMAMK